MLVVNICQHEHSPGRPVNLATNCAKHLLCELKHSHVDHVESARGIQANVKSATRHGRRQQELHKSIECKIDAIPPPPWSAAILTENLVSGNGSQTLAVNDQKAAHPSTQMAALCNVDLEVAECVKASRKQKSCQSYIDDINSLAKSMTAMRTEDLLARRGCQSFLLFKRDFRLSLPRLPDESSVQFNMRAMQEAKEAWRTVPCLRRTTN